MSSNKKEEIYQIVDDMHAEPYKNCKSFEEALVEIKKLTKMNFDKLPLLPPCMTGVNCTRLYEIHHYNISKIPWSSIKKISVVRIEKDRVEWLLNL